MLLWHALLNPLVILLAVLATISFATGDPRAAIMMSVMIVLSVGLKLIQEAKAGRAAAKLKAYWQSPAKTLSREVPWRVTRHRIPRTTSAT